MQHILVSITSHEFYVPYFFSLLAISSICCCSVKYWPSLCIWLNFFPTNLYVYKHDGNWQWRFSRLYCWWKHCIPFFPSSGKRTLTAWEVYLGSFYSKYLWKILQGEQLMGSDVRFWLLYLHNISHQIVTEDVHICPEI